MDPFTRGAKKINPYQLKILDECLQRTQAGLSLPMGSGKTYISLLLGLNNINKLNDEHAGEKHLMLVICEKSLIPSWEMEIRKFFGKTLKYEVVHTERINIKLWKPKPDTQLILTTPYVISTAYTTCNIERQYISYTWRQVRYMEVAIKNYAIPKNKWLNDEFGLGYFYSINWGALIIDEVQKFTSIDTIAFKSISSLCATHKWLLSGTILDEPKIERIFGYYLLLNDLTVPRTLPEFTAFISSVDYKGMKHTMVIRKENTEFVKPIVHEHIIVNTMTEQEEIVYKMMKQVMIDINKRAKQLRAQGDRGGAKKYSSYLLPMLSHLRQILVCPIIPLTSAAIDMADYNNNSELSKILNDKIVDLHLDTWLNDINSIKSSRITQVIKTIEKHPDECIVLFSAFRTCINVIQSFIKDRTIFTLTGSQSLKKRTEIIEQFEKSGNGVLLLTYDIGANGLNLQCSSTVLLVDFWWNSSTTQQAIARILRMGQQALSVNIYFFTSNTGLENCLFEKHSAKQQAIDELMSGAIKTSIPKIQMHDIIKMIELEKNVALIEKINTHHHK